MTSHVHLNIGTHGNPMQDILRDLKSFTQENSDSVLRKIQLKAGESGC